MKKILGTALFCAITMGPGPSTSAEANANGSPNADSNANAALHLLNRLVDENILGESPPTLRIRLESPEAGSNSHGQHIADLSQQLHDARTQNATLQAELSALQAAPPQPPGPATPGDTGPLQERLAASMANEAAHQQKSEALAARLDTATVELDALKKRLADLQNGTGRAAPAPVPAAAQAQTAAAFTLGKTPSKDARSSYAVGAWYGDSAPQETEKFKSIGLKFDARAFAQGFQDKLNNRTQLPPDAIAADLAQIDKLLSTAMLSENQKLSVAMLDKAAKEKGAIKTPEGAVYVIVNPGKAPFATSQSEILFELDERLATGEVLTTAERANSKVQDLPPLFQIVVKKLGAGGSARMHIPGDQVYGEAGIPGVVPPGALAIMSIKVLDIK